MGYTKLFSSIVASTIWREDDKTRLVWITMLALKNERHIVEASVPGLADLARVTVDQCREAIAKLEAPDPDSRSTQFKGRRIEKCEGGWLILNGAFYRQQMSADDRREYQRQKQAEYRAKRKELRRGTPLPGEAAFVKADRDGDHQAADEISGRGLVGPEPGSGEFGREILGGGR